MPTAECPSLNALDGDAWRAYLTTIIDRDPATDAVRVGRRRVTESHGRQLHRWMREGALPSFWTADAFLTRYHLHVDLFFGFAETMGRSPWAHGEPPAWHEEDWSWEDASWSSSVSREDSTEDSTERVELAAA